MNAVDRLDRYVDDVISGRRVACEWVVLACRRHRRDMETAEARGLYFDSDAAEVIVRFFERVLRHSKGRWAGKTVALEDWEVFLLATLFGWKVGDEDGPRRFRSAYWEIPRKNGKTLLAAGIGLFGLVADREKGAEIYSTATTREQAKLCFEEAERMVKQSAELQDEITIRRLNLSHEATFSKFEPLSADYKSQEGKNVHMGICDELHVWESGGMWDVLELGTSSRDQPLLIAITTAGSDRQSICFQFHDYTEKVLAGTVDDDSWHGIIYTLDMPVLDSDGNEIEPGDDYNDQSVWEKANPNLGISKQAEDLDRLIQRADEMPSRLNQLLNKHFNIWTQSTTRWLSRKRWDRCGLVRYSEEDLIGRVCYSGLDLGSTNDLTAWGMLFPPVEVHEPYKCLVRFFAPADNVVARERENRVPFSVWESQGWLNLTEGNVTDDEFILWQIQQDMKRYSVAALAFDRWGSRSIVNRLVEMGFSVDPKKAKLTGQPVVYDWGQGIASMSGPSKEFEKLVNNGQLAHGNNPVLSWMADNVVIYMDAAGNIKPDKGKSREKIDGIVALVMALGVSQLGVKHDSVYTGRGLRVL